MIEIPLAVVADSANVSREGKLNILGIFDNISASKVPATHPQLSLVIAFEAERAESERDHALKIQLVDADGKNIFNLEGDIKFSRPTQGVYKVRYNHIMSINNITFPQYGTYEFNILINNCLFR